MTGPGEYSFATVTCALEGLEQARRYSSQIAVLLEQLGAVLAQLDTVLEVMVVGEEGGE